MTVFKSGEDGYHTFRIPAVIATKKGTLLAFCEGRRASRSDTGDIDLVLKRSTDGGRTWGPLQVVVDHGPDTVGNPCPVVDDASGTIWLPLTGNKGEDTESEIKSGKSADTRRVYMTSSSDDGQTWAKLADLTDTLKKPGWTWYATGPGIGIQLRHGASRGRLVIPCDFNRKEGDARGSHVIYSDDAGRTWKLGGEINPHTNECQVAERRDGSLLMNCRSYAKAPDDKRRAIAISEDAGLTWSKVAYDATLIEPVCQASLIRDDDPKHPDRRLMLFSNPADAAKRVRMTVRLSEDDGRTWPVQKVLFEGQSAYSCLISLGGGVYGCLYERGEKSAYETIVFHRFALSR